MDSRQLHHQYQDIPDPQVGHWDEFQVNLNSISSERVDHHARLVLELMESIRYPVCNISFLGRLELLVACHVLCLCQDVVRPQGIIFFNFFCIAVTALQFVS